MAPDYIGIGTLVLSVLGGGALLFAAVGAVVASKPGKGAWIGVVVYVAFLVGMVAMVAGYEAWHHFKREHEAAVRADGVKQTTALMHARCQLDERFVLTRPVAPGSSVLIDLYGDGQSRTVFYRRTEARHKAMEAQLRKLGIPVDMNSWDRQYHHEIAWIDAATQPQTIAQLMHTDWVEVRTQYPIHGKSFYRLSEKGGRIPLEQPGTQYVFTVEDISTLDDRKDWLTRGRIRLLDAATSEVVAEYVGFQSQLYAGLLCPSAIPGATEPGRPRNVLRYFFGRVLQP